MYEHLTYEQDGPVTLITINRPERMNAIGAQTNRELVDAWERFRDDDEAYVAVLTGAGDRAFCAGGDLKSGLDGEPVVAFEPEERAAHVRGERPGVLGPSRWTDLYKPTIAAVNGAAYAGGLEWVCWTDLAIADEHATLRGDLPALEHRPGRRRHPAPAAHRGDAPGDGADHHRPRDRRRGGAEHRPGERGGAERRPAWRERSSLRVR